MFYLTYLIVFLSTNYLTVQSILMVPYMAMYIYTNENDFNVVLVLAVYLHILSALKNIVRFIFSFVLIAESKLDLI